LAGSLNVPLQYDSLAALSPVVRKEVLSGELTRRLKGMNAVPNDEVEGIVESVVALSLSEVVSVIQDAGKLADHVRAAGAAKSIPASPSPAASQDSRLLDAVTNAAVASAPEHPSTPLSVPASLSTPPRTSSPSGSLPPTSERERMVAAISKLEKAHVSELTELLMSLPKRERALCLFNTEILRAKIADAKVVLDSEESEDPVEQQEPAPVPVVPATPQARKVSQSTILSSPHTPDLSSRGASASASPAPQTPSAPSSNYTVSSLAQMSFAEIYGLVNSGVELPMLKISPEQLKESEQWVGTVSAHTLPTFKEQVGRKWFVL
jgi:polyadenylate-binding protein